MIVRRETPADVADIRAVVAAAFATPETPEPIEAPLVDRLRADAGWLPALSMVAVADGGEVVGHVVCTRGHVGDTPALGLGPLSVRPDRQRQGVGLALMHAVLGAADALGEPLVALLGNPAYYGRYGFRAATDHGVEPPDPAWGAYFQVRTLSAYRPSMKGGFRYAEPFDGL
ncbi:GNAT family N-acetyltransferase [Acrocarpospora phusangensis]|uniref:GNAT family N-acetyltransferase n=1 Tax=Acrocarpospora phusangensis TaxID=1070424 RepID=UPI001951E9FC|nr:N-acetyltransferase [Acrocarpospora phusangensis]